MDTGDQIICKNPYIKEEHNGQKRKKKYKRTNNDLQSIKGDLLCWLNSYLSNRTQRVMIKDALSGIGHLHAGVPQGLVFRPLMFLIFINDITD